MPVHLTQGTAPGKSFSEEKAGQIDEEVFRFVEEARLRVQKILGDHHPVLDKLAHMLSQKEMVMGIELRKMLGKEVPEQSSAETQVSQP